MRKIDLFRQIDERLYNRRHFVLGSLAAAFLQGCATELTPAELADVDRLGTFELCPDGLAW